jgi:hypothetical protein
MDAVFHITELPHTPLSIHFCNMARGTIANSPCIVLGVAKDGAHAPIVIPSDVVMLYPSFNNLLPPTHCFASSSLAFFDADEILREVSRYGSAVLLSHLLG